MPTWVAGSVDEGVVAPETQLRLTFVLARSVAAEAAFRQLLAEQQNSSSPRFHHWLTPEAIGREFGPSIHDLEALTHWLSAQGFSITEVAPSGMFVTTATSSATAEAALGTAFHRLRGAEPRLAAVGLPQLPVALLPVVSAISGLYDVSLAPLHRLEIKPMPRRQAVANGSRPRPRTTFADGSHFLLPADFNVIYSIPTPSAAGVDGSGQSIAIVGRSRVLPADITALEELAGMPERLPNEIVPPTGIDPGMTQNGNQVEATLDVNRALGTAAGAHVDLVISASAGGGITTAAQYEVQTPLDPIMSISFGGCEAGATQQDVLFWDTLFTQAAAEGISTFVASGDSGADGCFSGGSTTPVTQQRSINLLCSSASVTCVGGTQFSDLYAYRGWSETNDDNGRSASGYINEGAWNEPTLTGANGATGFRVAATGGGVSMFIAKPSWQRGLGVPPDGFRDVPDVSFSSSAHDGYIICLGFAGAGCGGGNVGIVAGTSVAAPAMAAIAALTNQRLGGAQGNLNPLLYRVARAAPEVGPAAFHDVTPETSGVTLCDVTVPSFCNNTSPSPTGLTGGLVGYPVTAGYDLATGLGSLSARDFLEAAALSPAIAPTYLSLFPSPSIHSTGAGQGRANPSQTVFFQATVTANDPGRVTGTVQFLSNGMPTGDPLAIDADGTATTAPMSLTSSGVFAISATYSGDTGFAPSASNTFNLEVTAAPSAMTRTTFTMQSTSLALGAFVIFTSTVAPIIASSIPVLGSTQIYVDGAVLQEVGQNQLDGKTYTSVAIALSPGVHAITASFLGDENYLPSTSPAQTLTVGRGPTRLEVATEASTLATGEPTRLTLQVFDSGSSRLVPSGTVEFFRSGASLGVASLVDGRAVFTTQSDAAAATHEITGTYSGDNNFLPTTSPVALFTIAPGLPYALSASSSTLLFRAGEGAPGNIAVIAVAPTASFTANVNLACSIHFLDNGTATLPPTCSFDSNFIPFPLAQTAISHLRIYTVAPHVASSTGEPLRRWPGGTPLAIGSVAFCMLVSRRLRWTWGPLLRSATFCLLLVLAGCGGGSTSSGGTGTSGGGTGSGGGSGSTPATIGGTTPGKYMITVTSTNTGGLSDPRQSLSRSPFGGADREPGACVLV